MSFLYHAVPKDLQGHILYPLNQLKMTKPELYEAKVTKYQGREFVLEERIPLLNCLWSDVLFFSPVHPKEVKHAMESLGHSFSGLFYQVDPSILDPSKTVVYLFKHPEARPHLDEDFVWFNPDNLTRYAVFPEETLAYYKRMFAGNNRPLLYIHIPHILYRGALDVTEIPVVEV